MTILNISRNERLPKQHIWCFCYKWNFHPFWLLGNEHRMYLLSISLLQNTANTLFDTICEIKGPLLYCFRFEMILYSWLLSQKCRQRERTSLREGLRLPSNSTMKKIRRQLLYAMKPEVSLYMCFKFQSKVPTQ